MWLVGVVRWLVVGQCCCIVWLMSFVGWLGGVVSLSGWNCQLVGGCLFWCGWLLGRCCCVVWLLSFVGWCCWLVWSVGWSAGWWLVVFVWLVHVGGWLIGWSG